MKNAALSVLVALSLPFTHSGQSGGTFHIGRSVIAGGGGTASGGIFSLSGTIAQPAADKNPSGGIFSVKGGFWGEFLPNTSFATVSGQVKGVDERFVKNSQVRITGGLVDRTIVSGKLGSFQFDDIPRGNTYVIQVTSRRFTYQPVMVTVSDNVSGIIISPVQ